MYVEQMYTGCLAEAAYYIESNGVAAVIDPMRETAPYTEKAKQRGATIKYVFETHFHADFVSGHVDLAKKTGAKIVFGPTAKAGYDTITGEDGQIFEIGDIKIKLLHTPGHTVESSSYLLIDENGKESMVFSGDTLFIGEVGRPDLAVKSDLSINDLAGMLYDSLRYKIMTLPDDVIVYPGHGAGSACGKNISSERHSTIGEQKQFNYALQPMTKEQFIKNVTTGILPPPQYFPKNAVINKMGYEDLDNIMQRSVQPMSIEQMEAEIAKGALLLDTRDQHEFVKGFIKGAINIALDGNYAGWAGTLIEDLEQPIVLITDHGRESEATLRLARVGYTNVKGYLNSGFDAWTKAEKAIETIASISADEFKSRLENDKDIHVLDVRKPGEYEAEHVKNAVSFPLDFIRDRMEDLNKEQTHYLYCRSGYRSVIAASILHAQGIQNVVDIAGGMTAISETDIPVSEYVCPSTIQEATV